MSLDPSRRAFMAAAGAVAIGAVIPARAAAGNDYRTAGELMKVLADRQVSSRELVDAAIARIEAIDPKINAVVVRDFDRAREAAAAADVALAKGDSQPLLGLPITVKENFNVAGLPTSIGDPKFKDRRPQADTLAVERLKTAGAVILGKTNLPLAARDWQSYNEVYGTTNNPWDLSRTPGGSSGGSAAALAAGYVPLELGADIGGSLRCPAHFCGIFSHKPSLDLIPFRGAGPLPMPIPLRGDLAVIGPMARSAADLALELSVLAGPDPLTEGVGYKLALPPPRYARLADFHLLVLDKRPLCPTAASITGALNALAGRLEKLGCRISRDHPKLPDLAQTARTYRQLLAASYLADLPSETIEQMNARAKTLSPDDQSYFAAVVRGLTISHADWIRQSRARVGLRARWLDLFHDINIVLCPPMPTVAFPHDHSPQFASRCRITTRASGPGSRYLSGCRRRRCRLARAPKGCRSVFRSSGAISKTARRSPSPS
jgi:amidase